MIWECTDCGHLHGCNPSKCADCGHRVLVQDRTADESEITPSDSLRENIIAAVAEVTNEDPDEFPPLEEVIDPDAVESLVRGRRSGPFRFRCNGFEVIIYPSGAVDVEPIDDE